ncbi:MAG: hypothetical protein ACKO1M_11745, partial [Planctomycetota bacterium]
RLFRARGFTVARNIPFHEYGVSFHIDGWDAKARVGFEFLSSEDEDHDDLSLREYQTLMASQQRGELSLFILDEVEPLSVVDLTGMANDFLDEVAEAAAARKAGRRPTAGQSAGTKLAGRKPVAKKAASKPAARKPAAKAVVTRVAAKKPAKPVKKAVARPAKKRAAKKPAAKKSRSR